MSAHQITPQAAAPAAPCVLVIFGGGGHVTQRRLISAIGRPAQEKRLSGRFAIVGVDRVAFDSASYRARIDSEIGAFLGDEFSNAHWRALPPRDFPDYAAGTWGPPEADDLLRRDGRARKDCDTCLS